MPAMNRQVAFAVFGVLVALVLLGYDLWLLSHVTIG